MKSYLIIIHFYLFICSLQICYSRDINENKLYKEGDYVGAAIMFHNTFLNAKSDSEIKNEASYYKFKSAQKALEIMSKRYHDLINEHYIAVANPVNGPKSPATIIWKNAELLNKTEILILTNLGFNIVGPQHYLLPTYAFSDWKILQNLAKKFPKSKWGELSAFEMIDIESGIECIEIPNTVIKNANAFLLQYPDSNLKYDVYHKLAYAYNDLTNCDVHSCNDTNTRDFAYRQKLSSCKYAEEYGKKALYYFDIIFENKNKLINNPLNETDIRVYEDLKLGKHSHVWFYYSD